MKVDIGRKGGEGVSCEDRRTLKLVRRQSQIVNAAWIDKVLSWVGVWIRAKNPLASLDVSDSKTPGSGGATAFWPGDRVWMRPGWLSLSAQEEVGVELVRGDRLGLSSDTGAWNWMISADGDLPRWSIGSHWLEDI